jgi:hypothetical protein
MDLPAQVAYFAHTFCAEAGKRLPEAPIITQVVLVLALGKWLILPIVVGGFP